MHSDTDVEAISISYGFSVLLKSISAHPWKGTWNLPITKHYSTSYELPVRRCTYTVVLGQVHQFNIIVLLARCCSLSLMSGRLDLCMKTSLKDLDNFQSHSPIIRQHPVLCSLTDTVQSNHSAASSLRLRF